MDTITNNIFLETLQGQFKNKELIKEESPEVDFQVELQTRNTPNTRGYDYTINTYKWLKGILSFDKLCLEFKEFSEKLGFINWDSETYGISKEQEQRIKDKGLIIEEYTHNTYNEESNLSNVLQYTAIKKSEWDDEYYVILQVQNGGDVRGNYTDGVLYKVSNEWALSQRNVEGTIDGLNVSNIYDGNKLCYDNNDSDREETGEGKEIEVKETTKGSLYIVTY